MHQITSKLKYYLQEMIDLNAGDLNITEGENISFRVGVDIVKKEDSRVSKEVIQNVVKDITGTDSSLIDLFKPKELDGSYRFSHKGKYYYFRYNISLTVRTIHLSIRKLASSIPSYETIQLDSEEMKPFVEDFKLIKEGLYLIVGATGSGKSTTIITLIDTILKESKIKTITLESPIEYYFNSLSYKNSIILQREVGRDTESFYTGLVAAMRQNPDVIFVGEIRDKDTAEAVMNAALTGHMVVATLHAKSVEKTVDRMKYLLGDITNDFDFINGIVYQKLSKVDGKVIARRNVKVNGIL
jgi:twitching motility protein PilT